MTARDEKPSPLDSFLGHFERFLHARFGQRLKDKETTIPLVIKDARSVLRPLYSLGDPTAETVQDALFRSSQTTLRGVIDIVQNPEEWKAFLILVFNTSQITAPFVPSPAKSQPPSIKKKPKDYIPDGPDIVVKQPKVPKELTKEHFKGLKLSDIPSSLLEELKLLGIRSQYEDQNVPAWLYDIYTNALNQKDLDGMTLLHKIYDLTIAIESSKRDRESSKKRIIISPKWGQKPSL